jgi:hypothetical protein
VAEMVLAVDNLPAVVAVSAFPVKLPVKLFEYMLLQRKRFVPKV